MKRLMLVIISVLAVAIFVEADRTRRSGIKVKPDMTAVVSDAGEDVTTDTLSGDGIDSLIRRSGYDKPLRSSVETIFVTNRLSQTLSAIELMLTYTDASGRVLHRVTRWIACDIPPGETRMLTFSSWDRQQSFYYRRSHRPRRASGSVFDVSTTIGRAVVISMTH